MQPKPQQLSLNIQLQADATFRNFWVSPGNRVVMQALRLFSENQGEQSLVIWGSRGCGLTHLLQACSQHSDTAIAYLPLKDALDLDPAEVCQNLERMPLVCIDDLDQIAHKSDWQQAIFHLYNRLKDSGHRLLMACHQNPNDIELSLPDLKSRILGSLVYHVDKLTGEQKNQALRMRAKERGMEMSPDVAAYVIRQSPQGIKRLFAQLEVLDAASLRAQKKLTLRFVKDVLGDG